MSSVNLGFGRIFIILHPRPEDGAKYYNWQGQWSGGRRKQALRLHPTAQVRGLNRKRNTFLVGRFNWWDSHRANCPVQVYGDILSHDGQSKNIAGNASLTKENLVRSSNASSAA
jgi:hypothetical protein